MFRFLENFAGSQIQGAAAEVNFIQKQIEIDREKRRKEREERVKELSFEI